MNDDDGPASGELDLFSLRLEFAERSSNTLASQGKASTALNIVSIARSEASTQWRTSAGLEEP